MKKIGIAGAGGIGSNVADNLVRMGFTNLKIVDFDNIEASNLNRQFYFTDQIGQEKVSALKKNLSRINPDAKFETESIKINNKNIQNIFQECPVVIEGFDRKKYKKIFLENLAETKELAVSASGVAGKKLSNIAVKKVSNCYIVGDFSSELKEHALFAPKVRYIAAKMSNIILTKGGFNV